jgi:murein DD-endopeptidase MepM/ murein hydrolase activator NlpD
MNMPLNRGDRGPTYYPMRGAYRSVLAVVLLTAGLSACGWVQWPPPSRYAQNRPTPVNQPQQARSDGAVVVARGDTVYGLSKRYNVPTKSIIDANRLAPPYYLYVGQKLTVPGSGPAPAATPAIDYMPMPQDRSVPQIAEAPARSASVQVSTLSTPSAPSVIAAPREDYVPPPPEPVTVVPPPLPEPVRGVLPPQSQVQPQPIEAALPPAAVPAAPSPVLEQAPTETPKPVAMLPKPALRSGGFLWPLSNGRVLSGFGAQGSGLQNDGINIEAPRGAPIHAAENGVVAYAGNEIRGFGNMLLIKHDGGWVTAYAHADQLLVKRGDVIKKGDVIARVGSTGSVDKPQLHFELRQGKKPVDPTRYIKDSST